MERRAARWGDRSAVIDISEEGPYAPAERDRITYSGLARLIEHSTSALVDTGIRSGDTVGSLTRNRIAALALLFACRRLGATFAPISHRLTPATVHRPLEVLDPALLVFEPAQRDLIRELPPAQTATFDDLAGVDRSSADVPSSDARAPETVPLLALHDESGNRVATYSAAAVEWNCLTVALTLGIDRGDRLPLLGPLSSYDFLLRVALPTLYVGAALVLDRAFDPADALAAIRRERATVLVGRAVEFRELAGRDGFDAALESVDRAVSETAPDEGVRDAYVARGVPIDRAYGRLECPTAFVQSCGEGAETSASDVGTPVLDCEARLVDDEGTVLERDAEGWLELAGPVLADRIDSAEGADAHDPALEGWLETNERFRRIDGRYRRLPP